VLGLFAGIRAEELQKLEWRHVNVRQASFPSRRDSQAGFIVTSLSLRTRGCGWPLLASQQRGCNAIHRAPWLQQAVEQGAPAAGLLKDWPSNALRHSFGSYACDMWNEEETKKRMGHRTPDILIRHYRTLVQPGRAFGSSASRRPRTLPWAKRSHLGLSLGQIRSNFSVRLTRWKCGVARHRSH